MNFNSSYTTNPNFNIGNETYPMQFYKNMRYPSSNITYKIHEGCSLEKKNHIDWAMNILENRTSLKFFNVQKNEEIDITCNNRNKIVNNSFFIAGEGGATKIIKSGQFNIILHGEVLLIRPSKCDKPLVTLHELLHSLGFKHSKNKNNVMFPYSDCNQILGENIPSLLNKLYLIKSEPDLEIEKASSTIHQRYLNANISIKNIGLINSPKSTLEIFADNSPIKNVTLQEIRPGTELNLKLKNYWVNEKNIENIKFYINSNFKELNKNNNLLILKKNTK